ncbi:hypothetical protein AX16_001051 [Volvariella volvacea WC 439]|nr:hypothetical protein AX16_001051 [Volvariella volvacea WC 439]
MICKAEARQVDEYLREKQGIDDEHGRLREHIEQLKVALEFAQMERRRKIEYDLVAEKVNTLPSRDELDSAISMLENDIATIQSEHDSQNRIIQQQKTALDTIITDLASLRFIGKDRDAASTVASPVHTPLPDESVADGTEDMPDGALDLLPLNEGSDEGGKAASEGAAPDTPNHNLEDDIEMGEVEEPKDNKTKKKLREELEEGEASDASSVLSDPPDD